MPRIEESVEIAAPLETVWAVAQDVESFPDFMPDVLSLKVLERSPDGLRTVTEWEGIIKEFKLTVRCTEEDVWDPQARTCAFRMLKGDFDSYEGLWTFTEEDGKVRFHCVVDYEYDVPLIGPLIKNIVALKMKQNAANILHAIKARAESR